MASTSFYALPALAEAAPPLPEPNEAPPPAEGASTEPEEEGFRFSGLLQTQYEHHQGSGDAIREDGSLLNQNRFLVRRARLRVSRAWEYSSFMLELDGNTNSGPNLRLFRAEASLKWPGDRPKSKAPLVAATMGLFDIPFGYELTESSRARYFMERSRASRAFFPASPDVGVKVWGEYGAFRYWLAAQNGEPLSSRTGFPAQDPNLAKDITARISARGDATSRIEISGGLSMLVGQGFHRGSEPSETDAATPSGNYSRWLGGADFQAAMETSFGMTNLVAEIQTGSNMDRGLFAAPLGSHRDIRELGFYIGITQQVTPYGVIGFRYDFYDPDATLFADRGREAFGDQRIHVFSPMLGLVLPKRARLLFQYDFVRDRMGMSASGRRVDLANDMWTVRLQVEP